MANPTTSDGGDEGEELDRIFDEIVNNCRHGVVPKREDFLTRYPRFANDIQEMFSTLIKVEQLDALNSSSILGTKSELGVIGLGFPKQLGDFELLHELGRGGMGVVFSARQISLDRPVAVKILSQHLASNKKFSARFLREAQSAARLHHPNIVAVIGNGSEQGYSYYAMQLIEGQNLNDVLDGVRHWREIAKRTNQENSYSVSHDFSRQLFEEEFGSTSKGKIDFVEGAIKDSSHESDSAKRLKSSSRESTLTNRQRYFTNVAILAKQITEALHYAHQHGIVHRDIKPSNLILDQTGEVWITDFGLAKLASDQQLTNTGDVLGTIRYMAPEQLSGASKPSCDIYGMGVTLYELITLRPALLGSNHAELLDGVRSQVPIEPRLIDSSIPRDLQTIILTAIAKDPSHRYRTAKEFAEDLDRFLNDMPIKARHPSSLEMVWRWSRRNKAIALTITIALVLFAVVIPSITTVYSFMLSKEVSRSKTAERLTEASRTDSQRQLVSSLITQARAQRMSSLHNKRASVLSTIARANEILKHTPMDLDLRRNLKMELCNEAVAALALPSFATDFEVELKPSNKQISEMTSLVDDHYVLSIDQKSEGPFTKVFRRGDAQPILSIPYFTFPATLTQDKRFLIAQSNSDLTIWDIQDKGILWQGKVQNLFSYSPGDSSVAAISLDNHLIRFDFAKRSLFHGRRLYDKELPHRYRSSPDASLYALIYKDQTMIFDATTDQKIATLNTTREEVVFDDGLWSRTSDWIALKASDGTIGIYTSPQWKLARLLLTDSGMGTQLTTSRDGRFLSTRSFAKRLQVWDLASGQEIWSVETPSQGQFLNLTNFQVGPICEYDRVRVLKLTASQVLQTYGVSLKQAEYPFGFAVSPKDPYIATTIAPERTVSFMNLDTGKLTHTEVYAETFCFDAQGNFWASEFGPVTCWQRSQSNGVVQFTNRHTQVSEQVTAFSVAGKANWIATSRNEMSIRPANDPKATPVPLEGGGDIRLVLISPDEKWVVGAGHNLAGCIVFKVPANSSRTPTASESWNLAPDSKLTRPIFSNDGTRLALQIPGEALRLYRAGEWNAPIQVWGPATGNVAFTHDGRFLAACLEPGVISLIELETGESILKLTHPADLSANAISFTRDGQKLIFSTLETNCFYSWNLSAIGNHLESLNLDTEHLTAFLKNAGGESLNTKTMASSSGRAEKDWVDFEQGQKSKYALLKELRTAVADKNDARTMKSLEQLVEVDPNDPDICNRLAWRLCLKSSASTPQLQRALGLIGKSLAADRESPSYQHTFGLIAYRLGLEEALRAAQFARDHLTITNTAYEDYLLALIHLKQGQLKISSDAWTKAIANHLKHDPFNYELWSFQWEWIYKMAACSPSLSQKGKGVRPL